MTQTSSEKRYRTPLFKAVRKVVDAVEDVVDDVVERGAGAERDGRRLLDNLFREKEEQEGEGSKRSRRTETTA